MKKVFLILLGLILVILPLYAVNPMIAQGCITYHAAALASDGTVYTWGCNDYGQLGNNSTTESHVPVSINTSGALSGKTITAVAAAYNFTVALDSEGKVYAWGDNEHGQLGNNSTTESHVPVAVSTSGVLSGKTITAIATAYQHTLALDSEGKVYAWGSDYDGQLGDNNCTESHVPVAVNTSGVLSGKTITAIAAGKAISMVLDSDGKVYTWGNNTNGELGNNSTTESWVPVAVDISGVLSGKTIIRISAGYDNMVALDSEGKVYTWGKNDYRQLNSTSGSNSSFPVAIFINSVLSGKTFTEIAAGGKHVMVLDSDGKVYAWGRNDYGQLGNDMSALNSGAVAVTTSGVLSGKTITAIASGYLHSVALGSDGQVYTWGYSDYGELGNGSTCESLVPVKVFGAGGVGELILPITLTDFKAETNNGIVQLTWQSASESNNAKYIIYRNGVILGSVDGAGTSSSTHNYTYVDDQIIPGNTYSYMLADVSYANEETKYPDRILIISVPENEIPAEFALEANYPNPFNPSTAISYQISADSNVDLSIYDINGKKVATLVKEYKQAGNYSITWDASNFNTGVYFYCLTAGDYVKTKKMVYIK